jgi:RNA polymerase sigma factor (sigma-70 family)
LLFNQLWSDAPRLWEFGPPFPSTLIKVRPPRREGLVLSTDPCHIGRVDSLPLIGSLRRALRNLLRSRGQSREDTEDLIQEAFLRLHAFMNEGRHVKTPEAFLVRTALNLVVDAHRHSRRDVHTVELVDLDLVDDTPTPDEIFAAEERLRRVRELLETALSAESREAYLLHRLDGFTYEEIAQRLRITVRTVEYHIARATNILALYRQQERESKGGP